MWASKSGSIDENEGEVRLAVAIEVSDRERCRQEEVEAGKNVIRHSRFNGGAERSIAVPRVAVFREIPGNQEGRLAIWNREADAGVERSVAVPEENGDGTRTGLGDGEVDGGRWLREDSETG